MYVSNYIYVFNLDNAEKSQHWLKGIEQGSDKELNSESKCKE